MTIKRRSGSRKGKDLSQAMEQDTRSFDEVRKYARQMRSGLSDAKSNQAEHLNHLRRKLSDTQDKKQQEFIIKEIKLKEKELEFLNKNTENVDKQARILDTVLTKISKDGKLNSEREKLLTQTLKELENFRKQTSVNIETHNLTSDAFDAYRQAEKERVDKWTRRYNENVAAPINRTGAVHTPVKAGMSVMFGGIGANIVDDLFDVSGKLEKGLHSIVGGVGRKLFGIKKQESIEDVLNRIDKKVSEDGDVEDTKEDVEDIKDTVEDIARELQLETRRRGIRERIAELTKRKEKVAKIKERGLLGNLFSKVSKLVSGKGLMRLFTGGLGALFKGGGGLLRLLAPVMPLLLKGALIAGGVALIAWVGKKVWDKYGDTITEGISNTVDRVTEKVTNAFDWITNLGSTVWGKIAKFLNIDIPDFDSKSLSGKVATLADATLTNSPLKHTPIGKAYSTAKATANVVSVGVENVSTGITNTYDKLANKWYAPANPADSIPVIQAAAKEVGVPAEWLIAMARRESALNPVAKNTKSTAKGLFQFIDKTWAEMYAKYGAQYKIPNNAYNPRANAILGALYMRDNINMLKENNLPVEWGTVYGAHFLGPNGIKRLASADPNDLAQDHVGSGVPKANPTIFFDKKGNPRTVAEVLQNLNTKPKDAYNSFKSLDQMSMPNITGTAPVSGDMRQSDIPVYLQAPSNNQSTGNETPAPNNPVGAAINVDEIPMYPKSSQDLTALALGHLS